MDITRLLEMLATGECCAGNNNGIDVFIRASSSGVKERFLTENAHREWAFNLNDVAFNEESLSIVANDWKMILRLIEKRPDEMVRVVNLIQDGLLEDATELAAKIGLDERKFIAKGGGWVFLAVFAVAVVMVLSNPTELDDPDPLPPDPVKRKIEKEEEDTLKKAADLFNNLDNRRLR